MRYVLLLIVLAIMSSAYSRTAGAQCGYFGECTGGAHKLPQTTPSNENPHSNCLACIEGVCHPVCGGGFASKPAMQANYQAVLAAANAGDVARVIRLGKQTPGYIMYNARRQTVQILSCTEEGVLANLPIRSQGELAMAKHLPSSERVLAFAELRRATTRTTGGI